MSVERGRPIDLAERARSIPFLRHLGIELGDFRPGLARMYLQIGPEHRNFLGTLHGGATCSLIDTVTYFAMRPMLNEDLPLLTLEMKVNFLRPIREGRITAEAEVLHAGRKVMVAQVRVTDSEGGLCAFGTVTCFVVSQN